MAPVLHMLPAYNDCQETTAAINRETTIQSGLSL
ncbi:hypothetical protein MP213Fo_21250 [Pseudochrobactrum sp. MP213Fo]